MFRSTPTFLLLALLLATLLPVTLSAAKIPYCPLGLAAKKGDLAEVVRLLDAGAKIDEKSGPYEETPLMSAADRGHLPVVAKLLERGADIHVQGKVGDTALLEAAYHGRVEICALLLKHGAKINAVNFEGWTALHQAICRAAELPRPNGQNLAVVKLLVNAGADLSLKSQGGLTPKGMLRDRLTGEREAIATYLRSKGAPDQ